MSDVAPGASPIHGTGLVARRRFAAGETLAHYLGPVVTRRPGPDAGGRIHALELAAGRWIDGNQAGNTARFANHSCEPNAEMVAAGDAARLVACRDIAEGEEITFDYGFGLADALGHPCRCGAPSCPGRIVAEPLRGSLRRHLRTRKPRD